MNALLRYALRVQGGFYLLTAAWALVATRHFLRYNNPFANVFEARSFAVLCLAVACFFLVASRREELLHPGAILGLAVAAGLAAMELFHIPGIGWTLLWFDFAVESGLILAYIVGLYSSTHARPLPR